MPRLLRKTKRKKAANKIGRPKRVARDLDQPLSEDEAPSLLAYYKSRGSIRETTRAQMYKARNLYITKGYNETQTAKAVGVPTSVVTRWVVLFDWQEERDAILFKHFRKAHNAQRRSKNLDERHDRIAGTMEECVERLLHKHLDPKDEFTLGPKDMNGLARAIRELQGVRRIVHDKPTQKVDVNKTLTLDTDGSFKNMSKMVESLFGDTPRINPPRNHQLEVSFPGGVQDAEFETILNDEAEEETEAD